MPTSGRQYIQFPSGHNPATYQFFYKTKLKPQILFAVVFFPAGKSGEDYSF